MAESEMGMAVGSYHPTDDAKECAFIRLRGATERFLLLLQYRSDHNYSVGWDAVERAMADYRAFQ